MPAANDHLASAVALSGASGSVTMDFTDADYTETGSPDEATWWGGPHKSLWFRWTAPSDGDFAFTLSTAPDMWDLAISPDAPDWDGFLANSQTWTGDGSDPAVVTVTAGDVLLMFADDYSYETGSPPTTNAVLSWEPYVPPPNATSWAVESGGGGFFHLAYEGDTALVNGTDLAGTTTVTVGGVSVSFDVLSGTQIRVHFTTTSRTGPVTLSNSSGSSNAPGDATVYHYGPWTQPADRWGPEADQTSVPSIVVTQSRSFPLIDDPVPDVWYDGPDTSQASPASPSSRPTGGSFGWGLLQSGDYETSGGPDHNFGHLSVDAGYVDVNNASSDDQGTLMPDVNPFTEGWVSDPHAVTYETEGGAGTPGTFEGRVKYHMNVIRNQDEVFAPRAYSGSPQHPGWGWRGQLRRLLPGDYAVWAGSGTNIFPAWLFPDSLTSREVLLDFDGDAPGSIVHVTNGDGNFPDTALSEELHLYEASGGTDLGVVELVADDPGQIIGLIATTDGYAAGSRPGAIVPSDPAGPHDSNVDLPWKDPADNKYKLGGQYVGSWGPWAVLWSVYYAPPRYRLIYDAPLTTPALTGLRSRQRATSTGGAPRIRQIRSRARSLRRGPGAIP